MKFKVMALIATSVFAACGGESKKNEQPAPQSADQGVNVATSVDEATAKTLPSMIVARVPLDAQGNELVDQGEARQVMGISAASGSDTASVAFDQGAKVSISDELDQDSSTSQWYWNTPWYPGKLLGRGTLWGRNPYIYSGGYSYGYNYSSNYRGNGCNYYTYYPSYSNGYGNSGYGNSGYGNSGYGNSGYGNSGYGNSGYGNSGYGY